jgi:hypothetical protein
MKAVDANVLARFFVDDTDDAQAAKQRPAAIAALAERSLVSAEPATALTEHRPVSPQAPSTPAIAGMGGAKK